MAVKIVIDAGHGGYDAGATYNGRKEKDDTLALALAVGEILEAQGYDVIYTRVEDVYDSPVQKARIGNESGADFFVSIHRNSSPSPNQYNGVQTLVYNNTGLKAVMAENVNNELGKVGYRKINVVERPETIRDAGYTAAQMVNEYYGISRTVPAFAEKPPQESAGYQILVGIYRAYGTASYQANRFINAGYDAMVYEDDGLYQVRVGNYHTIEDALIAQRELRDRGYDTLIVRKA